MIPTPRGWPRMSSGIYYQDAAAAIDWLCMAFGFEVRLKIAGEDGRIEHSELTYGEGLIMVGQASTGTNGRKSRDLLRSPKTLAGANTQSVMIFVDDAEAHCGHARGCGARIVEEPASHDYGLQYWTDRSYAALDLEAHLWWFTQRMRTAPET